MGCGGMNVVSTNRVTAYNYFQNFAVADSRDYCDFLGLPC